MTKNSMLKESLIVKQIFALPKLATAPLFFAYIMHIEKKKSA